MINIRKVNGYDEYFVGDDGSVYRAMKPWVSTNYLDIKLKGKHHMVHRPTESCENPDNSPEVS